MNLGPHATFIFVSYAVAAFILLSLIVWIVLDHRAQKRALDELEASGHMRRSSRGTP